jgi:TolB-like protein
MPRPPSAAQFFLRALATAMLVPLLLAVTGCRTPAVDARYVVDGTSYGVTEGAFRARWWNFYERGLSFADGGFLSEALADLEQARAGRSGDARRARTYGLHFVEYFVNREIGVVLYRQKRFAEAVPYLEQSIREERSEKAAYYLTRCRRELAAAAPRGEAPVIALATVPRITAARTIAIAGEAHSTSQLATLTVGNADVLPALTDTTVPFSHAVSLKPGPNRVRVAGVDVHGQRTQTDVEVICDPDPPLLSIVRQSARELLVRVTDATEYELVKLGNATVKRQDGAELLLAISQPGQAVTILVADQAGNRNGLRVSGSGVAGASLRPPPVRPVQLASARLLPGMLAQAPTQQPQVRTVAPASGIELAFKTRTLVVFADELLVAGVVHGAFTELQLDGEQRLASGRDTRFCFRRALQLGRNTVRVTATSAAGQTLSAELEVERRELPRQLPALRATLLLAPLAQTGGDVSADASHHALLTDALVAAGRFRLLERERLDLIELEAKLVRQRWIKASAAAKAGRRLAADYTLACTVRPTSRDLEVFARLIDNATGTVLATCDSYNVGGGPDDYVDVFKRFAERLQQQFPVVQQAVASSSRRGVVVDLGSEAGIRRGMRFVAFTEEAGLTDPVTGDVLIPGRIQLGGELAVATAESGRAVLRFVEKGSGNMEARGHVVAK